MHQNESTAMDFQYLNVIKRGEVGPAAIPCVALVHNERNILGEFLDHYRGLGPMAFYMVDDRSDDGSGEFLADQPDVTLFAPKDGSTFAEHLARWRSEILDRFADDRWCLAPDIDEHLVYRDFETRPLARLIKDLEAEGAQAMHCTMVDMYADEPLDRHVFHQGRLIDRFPFFDGPSSYRMLVARRPQLKRCPTPFFAVGGGMRERVFFGRDSRPLLARLLVRYQWGRLRRRMNPDQIERLVYSLERDVTSLLRARPPFNCSKIPLVKWKAGMAYSGGPHSLSRECRLSESSGALLHFVFTRGSDGIQKIVDRGQHASRSMMYRRVLSRMDTVSSPIGPESRRYTDSSSLGDLIR